MEKIESANQEALRRMLAGQPVSSNAPIPGASHLEKADDAHTMIDLGAARPVR